MSLLGWWHKLLGKPKVPLFCECNDVDCLFFMPMTETEYLDIQTRQPGAAVVLDGHEDYVDEVLERHDGYLVVRAP